MISTFLSWRMGSFGAVIVLGYLHKKICVVQQGIDQEKETDNKVNNSM